MNKKDFFIPYIGVVKYLKSFDLTNGTKDGAAEVLFGFFLAFYHTIWIAIPLGLLIIKIIN